MCFMLFGRQLPFSRRPEIGVPLSSSFLESKKMSKKLCVLLHDVRVFRHFRGNFFGLCTVSLIWFSLYLSTSIEGATLYLMGHLSSSLLYKNAILLTSPTASLSSNRKVTTCFFFILRGLCIIKCCLGTYFLIFFLFNFLLLSLDCSSECLIRKPHLSWVFLEHCCTAGKNFHF